MTLSQNAFSIVVVSPQLYHSASRYEIFVLYLIHVVPVILVPCKTLTLDTPTHKIPGNGQLGMKQGKIPKGDQSITFCSSS